MPNIQQLFNRHLASMTLKILIFGPDSNGTFGDARVNDIKNKRVEIRDHLKRKGHAADFPEDIIDPNAQPPLNNPALVENLLMRDYDVIINIVETHGSIAEAGQISMKANLAAKSLLFICDQHCGGYTYATCELAEQLGAVLNTFTYPDDITQCHLLTKVDSMINKIQMAKFYS